MIQVSVPLSCSLCSLAAVPTYYAVQVPRGRLTSPMHPNDGNNSRVLIALSLRSVLFTRFTDEK